MSRPPAGPTQGLYRSLLIMVALISLGLISAVILVSIENARTNDRLARLEEYTKGKGEQRDRENAELNQRIDDAVRQGRCELLDQIPQGGYSDHLRDVFGCGPGIPIDQLPPEIQDQLADRTPRIERPDPEPADAPPPAPVPSPDIRSGVQSSPKPAPEPPPPPLVDLGPVTDLCEAAGVCG